MREIFSPGHMTALILLLFLFSTAITYSQHSSFYDSYQLSPFLINPAAAGLDYYPVCEMSVKKDLSGFSGSPITLLLAGNFRIGKHDFYDPKGFIYKGRVKTTNRMGLGGAIYSDINGPLVVTGFVATYAYHLPLNNSSGFSLGMSFTGNHYSLNSSLLKPDQVGDNYLFSDNENKFMANMNFGIYYFNNNYFAGISANRVIRDVSNVCGQTEFRMSYFITTGYKIILREDFDLVQSILIKKIENEKLAVDITGKLFLKKQNWVAASYSTSEKLDFYLCLHLYRNLYTGYHYKVLLNEIISYNYGSHEIFIGTNLCPKILNRNEKSVDQFN